MLDIGAPTGTVTFLFTDIEGSTRLWDQHPDAMSEAMVIHDALLDKDVTNHRGYVFSRAGDGWGISFESPSDAINAALGIQSELEKTTWPSPIEAIKIRMGIHTGTSVERNGDYFGTTVNRAARVSAVGDGGQVLVTDAVHLLVVDDASEDWRFHDLGDHRLQDLVRSERIWQLDTTETPSTLADIAQRTVLGNLPPERTRVFGRDEELSAVIERARNERLVTLVGVGGVGKTTLAQSAARTLAEEFPAGGWFVDLAGVEDPEAVSQAVAASLGISQRTGMTITESLLEALSAEKRLIVLDNAEQIIGGVADLVDAILDHTSDATIIVTSREPLAIDGETIQRVSPLSVTPSEGTSPAVALFIERARRVAPDLDEVAFNIGTVGEICHLLDGLPLAIELAASQCETMLPAEILRALDDHSLTLRSTSRSTVDRHRSLSDLVAWSYERLDEHDKTVFCRLAVFSGGCTIEAARFVCSDDAIAEEDVAASLRNLTRKSMVLIERREPSTRFTMLETLRAFATDQFDAANDRTSTEEKHAEWFADLSASVGIGLAGPDESRHLQRLLADMPNVQRASVWAGEHAKFDLMTEIGASLPQLVASRIRPGMLDYAHEALRVLPAEHDARLNYAFALAYEMLFGGKITEAPKYFGSATSEVADRSTAEAMQSNFDHLSRFFVGDLEFVIDDAARAITAANDQRLTRLASAITTDHALAFHYLGQTEEAMTVSAKLSRIADDSGNPTMIAWARYLQGELASDSDATAAIEALEESVEYSASVDNDFVAGIALTVVAATAGRNGDTAIALDAMDRSLHLFWTLGNRPQLWTAVRNLVEILHSVGADRDALVLHAAVESDAEHAPEIFGPIGDRYTAMVEDITTALGGESVLAEAQGAALAYNEAVEFALDAVARAT